MCGISLAGNNGTKLYYEGYQEAVNTIFQQKYDLLSKVVIDVSWFP